MSSLAVRLFKQGNLCFALFFFTLFTDFFYYQLTYQKSSNVKVNRYQAAYIRSNCNFIGNCKMVTIIRIMLVGDLVFLHVFFGLPADIYIRWLIPWSLILLCTCVFIFFFYLFYLFCAFNTQHIFLTVL